MKNSKPKILFVNDEPLNQITTFINDDLILLRKWFSVEYLSLEKYGHARWDSVFSPSVWRAVARNDFVFVWFGNNSPAVIVAKLLGKRSVIVGGGTDIVFVPSIGYGLNRKNKVKFYLNTLGFKLTDRVLLFSESSHKDFLTIPGINPQKSQTLYLSVDVNKFKAEGTKKNQVLTVGYINESNMRRKGIQTFIEVASLTPEVKFRLIGKILDENTASYIRRTMPPNMEFFAYRDNNELLQRHIPLDYQQSKIYLQLSYHEGFGVALAEAMACECIPIVTNCGAMPEVVGDTGIYVPVEDPKSASLAIRKVLTSDSEFSGCKARDRIVKLFTKDKREYQLREIVQGLLS